MNNLVKIIDYRGIANIYYAAHGENFRISTGIKIEKNDFDKRGKIKSSFLNKNSALLSKINFIENFINDYVIKNQIEPKVKLVKTKLKEKKSEVLKSNHSILEFFEKFYEEKKSEFLNDKNKSISSLKDYKSFWNSLIDYQKYINKTLFLDDIDKKQVDDYRTFMYQEHIDNEEVKYVTKGNLNQNTFRKRISTLKSFYHWMSDNETIVEVPSFVLKYKVKKIETHKEVLTSREIMKLYNMNFTPQWHNKIKDAFVFACHTGMRYSDFTSVNKFHFRLKNNKYPFVRKRAEKVNEYFMVPLTDVAYAIAKKYDYNLNVATNQVFNRTLKELLETSELFNDETEILNEDNEPRKRFELIHSHSARHSFITNLVNENVAINDIMSMTGHKRLETLNIYIKKREPETNDILNSVFIK